jgi:hypothetical protein
MNSLIDIEAKLALMNSMSDDDAAKRKHRYNRQPILPARPNAYHTNFCTLADGTTGVLASVFL